MVSLCGPSLNVVDSLVRKEIQIKPKNEPVFFYCTCLVFHHGDNPGCSYKSKFSLGPEQRSNTSLVGSVLYCSGPQSILDK